MIIKIEEVPDIPILDFLKSEDKDQFIGLTLQTTPAGASLVATKSRRIKPDETPYCVLKHNIFAALLEKSKALCNTIYCKIEEEFLPDDTFAFSPSEVREVKILN